jgi:hypothetical protein
VPLTTAVSGASTETQLLSIVRALQGKFSATSRFLHIYASIICERLQHELSNARGSAPNSIFEERAKTKWFELENDTRQFFQVVWEESFQFLQTYRGPGIVPEDCDWFMAETDRFGCPCPKIVVLLFEHLQDAPSISDWITSFLDAQQRYLDPPSNLGEQLMYREKANFDILPDLDRIVGIFSSGTASTTAVCTRSSTVSLTSRISALTAGMLYVRRRRSA